VGADNLVQDCLTRALGKLHLWSEGTNLRAWLLTILHNQYVNQIRRSIRTGTIVEIDDSDLSLSRSANQEAGLELRDLDRALRQLVAEQREVILLIGLEGMSYDDAAAVLGIPTGTVRSRLSRGRLALRELMEVEPNRRDERRQMTKTRASLRKTQHLAEGTKGSALPATVG
jgi:RNA polymerase sigma-70 factor (ECF subfamily)